MNEHLELATIMLALAFSAVLPLTVYVYRGQLNVGDIRSLADNRMRQAQVSEGVDIRSISQPSPYMPLRALVEQVNS